MRPIPYYPLPWPDPLVPEYRQANIKNWRCVPTPAANRVLGYFRPHNFIPGGWMFEQKVKNKWVKWMSLTPMEQESHQPHIAAAKGVVVVAGLGMGFYLFNILRKPEVKRVVVLEKDQNLVNLFNKAINRRQWSSLDKFELAIGDALEFKPNFEVDFLYADIWEYLGEIEALNITKRIQNNVNAKEVGFWGQEFDYVTWLMDNKLSVTDASRTNYRKFVASTELPLIEQDSVQYPKLAAAAVTLQTSLRMKNKVDSAIVTNVAFELLNGAAVLDEVSDIALP